VSRNFSVDWISLFPYIMYILTISFLGYLF
jgi:hypothetical protein